MPSKYEEEKRQRFLQQRAAAAQELKRLIAARIRSTPTPQNPRLLACVERATPLRAAVYSRNYVGERGVIEQVFKSTDKRYVLIFFNEPLLITDETGEIWVALDLIEEFTSGPK